MNGTVYTLNAATGTPHWSVSVTGEQVGTVDVGRETEGGTESAPPGSDGGQSGLGIDLALLAVLL